MFYNSLFDRLFGFDGVNPFGHPGMLREALEQNYEDLEEEVFEVIKGDYKTILVCKFNKKGYLISHSAVSHMVTDEMMIKLKEELNKALEKEDYDEAVRVQKLINTKRESEEKKPTL